LATRRLARGVVLEDHVGRVHGHDRVEVVGVPGRVVAIDRLLQRRLGVLRVSAHRFSFHSGLGRCMGAAEMAGGYTIKHRDEFEAMEGSGECTWKLARKALGTSAFGFN